MPAESSQECRAVAALTVTFRFANGPVSVPVPALDQGERARLLAAVSLRAEDVEAP